MKNKKINTGGVALFNGILFSSDYRQVIAQKEANNIKCRTYNYIKSRKIINKLPIIRGIIGLSSQIGNATPEFIASGGEKSSKVNINFLYIIFMILYISIPILVSAIFPKRYQVLVQAITILFEFVIYLMMVKNTKELETIFMYHGAEHKAVNAYENLGEEGLTVQNIKKQKRFHKRCGGNFVVYFIILTILSLFLPIQNLLYKDIILVLLSIINIGVAYEIVNIFSTMPKPLDIINYPATLIQLITTKEPNDDMLKLAMYGVLASVRKEDGISICEYVKKYINNNLNNKEYDIQDIYSILEYITKIDRNKLFLDKNTILLKINQEIEADKLLNKYYNEKYPLQYITHKQYFYNEEYYVDEHVLIPRSDSEILVEKALEYIENENITKVIDLCTGSGALGISIAKNSKVECNIDLVDISADALSVANKNIVNNGVQNNVKTYLSNLLLYKIKEIENTDDIEIQNEMKVDMIVSNPPYIKTKVINSLQEEVKKEPHIALDGGENGLDFYIRIVDEAKKVLKENGLLLFEIGYDQLKDIKEIIKKNKEFKLLESVKDYGGNDRVVVCRFQDR